MSDPRSMGDVFRERRAAAAANKNVASNGSRQGAPQNGSQPMTFADIQREQQQQHLQQQRDQHPVDDFGRLVRPTGGGHGNPRSPNNESSHQYGNASNSSRRGTSNSGRGGRQNRASLPIEQGVIHTLLDKFGFIMCADRDMELFFHYSEFREGHSDELNIGDEVEFRVGRAEDRGGRRGGSSGDNEKLCALDVRRLPEGTVYWEKEDEPVGKRLKGIVDLVAREDHRGQRGGMRDRSGSKSAASEGIIRIADSEDHGNSDGEKFAIRYISSDYTSARSGQNRLERKDVVEFTLVTERRTGKKYARKITLIQSERDRQREEWEAKLLQDAPLERGKVVSNKGDFGFLRCTSRLEEVYFHVSHIVPPEAGGEGVVDFAKDEVSRGVLKEGQDVEFYVVDESVGGITSSGDRRRSKQSAKGLSARKIKVLPQGSVKFEDIIAEGVTGMVTECPVASGMEAFGRREDRRKSVQKVGQIRLDKAIKVEKSDGEQESITHVELSPEFYPGGTFAISRTGSELGCWIRPGDVLLFDVVKKVIDGSCRAFPTKFTHASDAEGDRSHSDKPAIRLIDPSLCGRAEGVLRTVHDNYAFIHLAERNADAYLPLYEVFPPEIMGDLVRNNPDLYRGDDISQSRGGRIDLEVGMEVSFDLSVQIMNNAGGRVGDRGRYGKQNRTLQEKESLRARRVQILPKGSVKEKIPIASEVKATVIKEDSKQPFLGTLELEKSLKIDTGSQRHPLAVKLLDEISAGKYGEEAVTFHDVLSEKDAQIVISMVNSRNDDLEWRYVPEDDAAEDNGFFRKLCISKKKSNIVAEENELDHIKPLLESATSALSEGKEETPLDEEKEKIGDGVSSAGTSHKKQDSLKKKTKKAKMIRTARFDKSSFPDISIGPLGVGDVLTCDVFQSRRSGAFSVENIVVVERKERFPVVVSDGEDAKVCEESTQRQGLTGFVTEVLPSRHFGFITAVDEKGSRTGDHVFFHFKEVEPSGDENGAGSDMAQDGSPMARSKRIDASNIRKGDEVKFDARPGKNGKLAATKVTILPRGTLTSVDSKAPTCTGFILMEPSHTSLANTPSHIVSHSGSAPSAGGGGSRWDIRDDKSMVSKSGSSAKEGGVILLLSDPSHLFSPKPKVEKPKTVETPSSSDSENNAGTGVSSANISDDTGMDKDNGNDAVRGERINENVKRDNVASVAVGMHLHYKTSSIKATYGASNRRNDKPKRGDLVRFGKTRGAKIVKDICIEKAGAATCVRGLLTQINKEAGTAVFDSSDSDAKYEIKLTEVVSCDLSMLKEKEQVDGILHDGKIFGVCRTKDIYLASSLGRKFGESHSSGGLKERPKLNLTVKKELQGMGGQIMAQSRMAKGPDGTIGFADGWTKRVSAYVVVEEEEEEATKSLSAAANEFIPNFPVIATSGFESIEDSTWNE